ncbi:GntR family transcriptional regulator, partial [Burkholderia cenocepacia]|uniref:GntR family transcriptional regulator n=1 Tax=Burkholderia cenocepacia TaxID=95486 RepID=UPI001EFA07D8
MLQCTIARQTCNILSILLQVGGKSCRGAVPLTRRHRLSRYLPQWTSVIYHNNIQRSSTLSEPPRHDRAPSGPAAAARMSTLTDVARDRPAASPASLADRAYALIQRDIITMRLKPGAALNEADLVARTGIGRTPVHQAVHR